MDLVRICSKTLGEAVVTINEEEAMDEILEVFCNLPVKKLANWIAKGISALPDDTTIMDLIMDEDKYDEMLDGTLLIEELIDEKTLADLRAKICGEEEED